MPIAAQGQAAVTRLIDAYREFGHYVADLDPLKLEPKGASRPNIWSRRRLA